MRHIIHKFVNVYPLIAYSCEVAIHIIISWILGSGPRWYGKWHSHNIQEQGNNYSWVDIIAILFEVFKYLLKNCFSDKFFLRAFIFPHAKFLKTRNLHLLWLQTKLCLILTTPWLPLYKRFCTVVQFPARGSTEVLLCLFPGVLWLSVHIQFKSPCIYPLLCRRHSWRVRLAKQETLTPPGHLVSLLVCRGPWMSTMVLYCWCRSDSASVILYFTLLQHIYS